MKNFPYSPLNRCTFFWLIFALHCDASGSPDHSPQEMELFSRYDWVPVSREEAIKRGLPPGCKGDYVTPENPVSQSVNGTEDETTSSPHLNNGTIAAQKTQNLVVEADSVEIRENQEVIFEGDVRVTQGDRKIRAERMEYNHTNESALMEGDVEVRQHNLLIRSSGASAQTLTDEATLNDAIFVFHDRHIRGSAESLRQVDDNIIQLNNGTITRCEPNSNTWQLSGQQITINQATRQGRGKHVKLKIADIPVFYLPYIAFPVGDQRQTGVLFPSISYSDNGLDIAVPYYINLAPNYDLTLTPRYIEGRGSMLETETRYLHRYFDTTVTGAYLHKDKGGNDSDVNQLIDSGALEETDIRSNINEDRWLLGFKQQGGSATGWFSRADFNKVSDIDYLRDLGATSFSTANSAYLNQQLELGYNLGQWRFLGGIHRYQSLIEGVAEPYRRQPQIRADAYYSLDEIHHSWFSHGYLSLENEYTVYASSASAPRSQIEGARLALDYALGTNWQRAWGFIHPQIGYKYREYRLDKRLKLDDNQNSVQLGAPQASLDLGLTFERQTTHALQTLEPRIYYLYRDFEDHSGLFNIGDDDQNINFDTSLRTFSFGQLYEDTRFNGKDRLDDAHQITLGLTHRWLSTSSGEEVLKASIGQIFYFDHRQVGITEDIDEESSSEIAGELSVRFNPHVDWATTAIYSREQKEFVRGQSSFRYHSEDYRTLFNFAYNYVRANSLSASAIKQLDASLLLPVTSQWSFIGRSLYDFQEKEELESFAGLEYNDCCYRLRIIGRRWLDSNVALRRDDGPGRFDEGIFFEVQLKGLGSSSPTVRSLLQESIPGFTQREVSEGL